MSVQCATCGSVIETPPKMPLSFADEDGRTVVLTDYAGVYEHVRDAHPDQWTDAMAASFGNYLAR